MTSRSSSILAGLLAAALGVAHFCLFVPDVPSPGDLVLAFPIALFIDVGWAALIPSVWLLACVWMAAQQALELDKATAALAAVGGYAAWVFIQAILSF